MDAVEEIECMFCAEKINSRAKKCKHCGEILDPTMRELDFLKAQKKDIYVTNNAASSVSAAQTTTTGANDDKKSGASTLAKLTLAGGILSFLYALGVCTQDIVTEENFGRSSEFLVLTLIFGIIVIVTNRRGKGMAITGMIIAFLSAMGVYGNMP